MPVPNFQHTDWDGAGKLSAETQRDALEIATNGDFSPEGKERKLESQRLNTAEKWAGFRKEYLEGHERLVANYEKIIEGPKPVTLRERIEKASKATSELDRYSIDDNERALAIIESNGNVVQALEKSSFIGLVSGLDAEGFSTLMQRSAEAGDFNKLDALKEIAEIRSDRNTVDAIEALTKRAREANWTFEQRRAAKFIELLELNKELFLYGLKVAERGEPFPDLRGGESYKRLVAEIEALETKNAR